ncbi:MAG: phosphodiester glycosidase family protein [Eubacteriales bacterium]|nr:phosphodiester glycosidase family protein [Eubacteriales bacterium]
MKRRLLWLAADLVLAALIVLSVWIVNYKIPHAGIQASGFPVEDMTQAVTLSTAGDTLRHTRVLTDLQDWRKKFADKFPDTVTATDTSYTSPNLSIQISSHHIDTGKLDLSDSGKHKAYGTQISYLLADIYVGDITCLQTAFAQNTYGVGYSEKLSDLSAAVGAVLAVNGDSYSNNHHKDNGTIIRNGVVYRSRQTDAETCVLNWDGTMEIYEPAQADLQRMIDRGAYQSWIFGPSLLDENGKAKTEFLTWDYIRQSHPRTAIGYYEPGHYCLLLVDGRQDASRGMFLDEMAQIFEELGCRLAYNLDGGHCSFMTYQDQVINHPYKPEHEVSDGIFITEGSLSDN